MNKAFGQRGKIFILSLVTLALVCTACSRTGSDGHGRSAPSVAAHEQASLSSRSTGSATELPAHLNMEDKVHNSALDSRWVHVPPAQARQFAHCGNTPRVVKGSDTTANVVWLTVDDHPAGHQENVDTFLSLGDRYNVRFRFFPVSHWTNEHPEVNNHTQNHIRLDQASDAVVTEQVATGVLGGPYFRPPYGAYDQRVVEAAKSVNQTVCTWTVDTADYSTSGDKALIRSPQDMLRRVQEQIGAHAVILMHFQGKYTLEALPLIIEWLRGNGYQPETLRRAQ